MPRFLVKLSLGKAKVSRAKARVGADAGPRAAVSRRPAETQPAARGSYVEIYATGLGPIGNGALLPEVTIGGVAAFVAYSGPVPEHPGVYQVNVQIPDGLSAGEQPLTLRINGVQSNTVKIGVR